MARLLLLTYAFQPDNTPAAARPSQLCRYLPDNGVHPYVLASSMDGERTSHPNVWRVPDGRERLSVTSASKLARGFMRFAAPYNDRQPWVPYAATSAARLIRTGQVDAVYSTSPFLASHFAAYWLKAKFGLPWIADFQDPICDNPFRTRKWFYAYDRGIEQRIFRKADRIIANTDAIAAVWRERYPERREAISVMWNSFDPEEEVPGAVHGERSFKLIAHVGTLYGGRHPGRLLESFRRLDVSATRARLKLIGPVDDAVLRTYHGMFEEMRGRGVLDYDNSLVPRSEALRETAEADCLLLLDVNERNTAFQVPSKLLDYIRIGKPILAYTPAASPVERILLRSGVAFVAVPPDAPDALADAKVQEFLNLSQQPRRPSDWFFETFSAETQARHVAGLVENLVGYSAVERRSPAVIAAVSDAADVSPRHAVPQMRANEDHLRRPLIVTTVDAEEEFDWNEPLSRNARSVRSMGEQHLLHRIFERNGVVPIYFVTYPIVTQAEGYAFLVDCLKDGRCQIGSQLHPWVTPPFEEAITAYNSFAGNLPEKLELAKLRTLTDAIAERFGVRPFAYRAGRYGVGSHTVQTLRSLGYRVDSSVVPEFSYRHAGGPVFFGKPANPYWLDEQVLELPLTSSYVGRLTGMTPAWPNFTNGLFQDDARHTLSRALMARSGLIERIRLTPEGTKVSDAKRLVRTLLKRGTRVFTLSYHSPSLVPGNTPYVRNDSDRERFLAWFEEFYDFFLGDLGGAPATTTQVYDLLRDGEGSSDVRAEAVSP
jgi:glycosyltransferase involved in cell wall biosynthesis